MKVMVIQGPNINMLGLREPGIYGRMKMEDIHKQMKAAADQAGIEIEFFQSNFEGEIVDYTTTPTAITAGQTAAMNRLTIKVKVRFTSRIDDTKDFEQTFSRYEDYPSDQDLNSVQESLTTTIVDQLVEDIFNKALVNW